MRRFQVPKNARRNSGFPAVAKQLRRLFGPCAGAVRQDVLAAAEVDAFSGDDVDDESWTVYRRAEIKGDEKKGEKDESRENGNTAKGGGRKLVVI